MTIGQFSERIGLPPSTLRYYEQKGLLIVSRDSGGRRVYDEKDLEWVRFLRRLKEAGMPLKDIRRCVPEQRDRWDAYLKNLDEKIGYYEEAVREPEG